MCASPNAAIYQGEEIYEIHAHLCTTRWLERQQAKLLPVDYFMVTFTLPAECRGVA